MICVINLISDVLIVFSSILLIELLGIDSVKNKKSLILSIVAVALLSISKYFLHLYGYKSLSFFIYPLMFVFAYLFAFKKVTFSHLYVFLLSELVTSLFSSCLASVVLTSFDIEAKLKNIIALFIVRLLYCAIIFVCKKKNRIKQIYLSFQTVPKYIYVLVLLSILLIIFLGEVNNHPNKSTAKQFTETVLIALLAIILVIIILSLILNVVSKNYYTALSALLEKQVAAQIDHYEKLEKLNSDMRTFRHDYINHLNSINALIGEGCCSDAQDYIAKLTESTHRNEAVFLTGNRLADAILTDKSDSCKEHADIVFDGCITDKIDNSDICIILANALDNAAEACQKCAERSRITIASQIRQGYWAMTMKNPTVSADSEGLMKTSKKDERNHGFGLISIEQTVKKYDGTMAVSIKDGVFELSVVLKIPDNK